MMRILSLAAGAVALCAGTAVFAQHYTQTNLVANTAGVAPVTDPSLVNPWGMSRGSGTPWWVSDNGTGLSTLYNGAGAKQGLVVMIPPANPSNPATPMGTPTGTIFNGSTTDFLLGPTTPALFLFSTIDGTIAGWNPAVGVAAGGTPPSTMAMTVVKTKDGSVYTGLTSATIEGKRYLYAANFALGRVDVYDSMFHRVRFDGRDDGRHDEFGRDDRRGEDEAFSDDRLPNDYVPFNVQAIGNDIVVTFVLHEKGQQVETDGPGLGYVDIFSARGELLQRLEHGDWLNAPWGVALAPTDFGVFSHDLLIGQFAGGGTTESSGFIAAYDLATGAFKGLLEDSAGAPLAINGIWAISPGNLNPSNSNASATAAGAELYFTAGPNHGSGGLLGYLTAAPTEQVTGNDQ